MCLCLFLSFLVKNHCFPCNSSVFWLLKSESLFLISVSGSCFLFLFCLFFVSRCSFVFVFLLVLLFCFESQYYMCFCIASFCCCCCCCLFFALVFCYFLIFGYLSKHLSKNRKFWKPPTWKCRKKRTFWQEHLAHVCSQIVFSSFCCVFRICMLCWKHYKNCGFSQTTNILLKIGPRLC